MADKKPNYHQRTGYSAQRKYDASHSELVKNAKRAYNARNHTARVIFPMEFKPILDELCQKTGLSANQLFLTAVEEKYGVILHKEK